MSEQAAELTDWLMSEGFSEQEIDEAFAPMLLPARRALGDDGIRLSARDIATRWDMDIDVLQRILHSAGRPRSDDPTAALYLTVDSQLVGYAQQCLGLGLPIEQVVAVVQVMTDGLAKTVEVMQFAALSAILQTDATELENAKAVAALTGFVAPLLGPMAQDMLRTQMLHALLQQEVAATERLTGPALPGAGMVSIAFADLVGFTSLGEELPPEGLERLSQRLADLARTLAQPPVRFIKTIGDEVMLVSPEPVPLLNMILDLVDAAEADEGLPRLKAGMATGMAVSRAGDWFGGAVNQASRVTGVARPGAVLLAESAREAVGAAPGFDWSFAGARRLKGIRDEIEMTKAEIAGTANELKAQRGAGGTFDDDEALRLLNQLDAEKKILEAQKKAEQEKEQAAQKEKSRLEQIDQLRKNEEDRLKEQLILLTQGKEAAQAFRLEQQGLGKDEANRIAMSQAELDKIAKESQPQNRQQLQAVESRLLTRGAGGEDPAKKTEEHTKKLAEQAVKQSKLLSDIAAGVNKPQNIVTLKTAG